MDLPFLFVIGRDIAGMVERTGAGVTRFGGRQGSFAELAAVREDLLYALPDPVDFAAMAALAHSGLAACLVNRIVVMSGLGARPVLPAGALYVRDISIRGFAITYATVAEMRACADRLNALAEAGRLNAKVAITLPLSEARRAHEMIEDRDLRLDGKIIMIPA